MNSPDTSPESDAKAFFGGRMRVVAVVPAAGSGSRFGGETPKQYAALSGQTVLAMTVAALAASPRIDAIVVVRSVDDDRETGFAPCAQPVWTLPIGGASRRDSVLAALQWLLAQGAAAESTVLVHDAARPGLPRDALERLLERGLGDPDGALLAMPVADTLKRADSQGRVAVTVSRDALWGAQTPQLFPLGRLTEALIELPSATDEASAMEAQGARPHLVNGDLRNMKVTWSTDLTLLRQLLNTAPTTTEAIPDMNTNALPHLRVGEGFDIHALVPGRKLILGGVDVPHHAGLLGHSDADALCHAVTDALFGAAALGDIGQHFPDTDERFKGADSRVLLREAVLRVQTAGYQIGNVDASIIAQAPRLAAFIPPMRQNLADDLGLPLDRVSVKARTAEKLGALGRNEGIAVKAVVLLFASD